jgi:glycerol kinase
VAEFVGAIDQGTTSTRFIIFDHDGREVARHQLEHPQLLPRPGWVEHDPMTIAERARTVVVAALDRAGITCADLAAIGVANQRETIVVWDRRTGRPYLNAVVWQDMRSDSIMAALGRSGRAEMVRERTGLPPATYFSAGKLQWILENVPEVRAGAQAGRACFGTIDTWLVWNMTGGPNGGRHITDVTNASRTMLMDLRTRQWDDELLDLFGVPQSMLPTICPSSGDFGQATPGGAGSPEVVVAAILGDQQAAMVGQVCFDPGEAKNTYGTGNFLLVNTGANIVRSSHGLLATVCYQMAGEDPAYALEGSIAVTGSAVQWLRDQLGLIGTAAETEALAAQVPDSGGAYFVPAFSGLFAPYWRADARGAIVGLTRATTKAHLARATLEAICFQTRDVLTAMEQDLGQPLGALKVDGGITANALCMQLQADILGHPVYQPAVAETTALGAAYAAGCAVGFWSGRAELRDKWREARRWEPEWDEERRENAYASWQKAVQRTLGWAAPA